MKKLYIIAIILFITFNSQAQWAGGLLINSTEKGVTVKINGVERGATPLRVILTPATYTIIAEKPINEYLIWYYEGKVTVTNGKIDDLNIKLEKKVTAAYHEKMAANRGTFTDPRDGKTYKTIKIGTQIWMAENLAYKTSKGCWVYNNDESTVAKYGRYYTYQAAQSACPAGWHFPSYNDLETLDNNFGGEKMSGEHLKSATGWNLYNGKNYGLNTSGFSGLPAGYRHFDGQFYGITEAYYWAVNVNGRSMVKILNPDNTYFNTTFFYDSYGLSVRCIKD